jgi:hypothetical protein
MMEEAEDEESDEIFEVVVVIKVEAARFIAIFNENYSN